MDAEDAANQYSGPGFDLAGVRAFMKDFTLRGEAVLRPLRLQMHEGPAAFTERHVLETGNRQEVFFSVHGIDSHAPALPRFEQQAKPMVAADGSSIHLRRGSEPKRLEKFNSGGQPSLVRPGHNVIIEGAWAYDALFQFDSHRLKQPVSGRRTQLGVVLENVQAARGH